ncbi:MAG: hypothetical protein ABJA79_03280 [Parafilimonas sp.]
MNIKLPDFLIVELYKNSLVDTDEAVISPIKSMTDKNAEDIQNEENKKWFLGDNKKRIVILVNEANAVFIDDNGLQLLTRILAGCNLNLADVAIINFHKNGSDYLQLKKALEPQYFFLFDVTSLQIQLPFTIPQYQIQHYDDCTFLLAPSLTSMLGEDEKTKEKKTKLWNCLKKIFNI